MSLGLRPPRRSKSMAMHSVTVQGCKGGLAACHIQWIVSHIIGDDHGRRGFSNTAPAGGANRSTFARVSSRRKYANAHVRAT